MDDYETPFREKILNYNSVNRCHYILNKNFSSTILNHLTNNYIKGKSYLKAFEIKYFSFFLPKNGKTVALNATNLTQN